MIKFMGFDPPFRRLEQAFWIIILVREERVKGQANCLALLGDLIVTHGNGFGS